MSWDTLVTRAPSGIEARTTFVEVTDTEQGKLSYSAVLDAQRCEEIDRRAYGMARAWYLQGGTDLTEIDGVSLGRAFELPATTMLVRLFRATAVLEAIGGSGPIALAGVGAEWESAARELGRPFIRLVDETGPSSLAVPDPMSTPPGAVQRMLARLASGSRSHREVAFLGSPRWAAPYLHALPARDLEVINPGLRALLASIRSPRRPSFWWPSDALAATAPAVDPGGGPEILRAALSAVSPRMAALAMAPAMRRRRVMIATEDVSPSARIAVLATLAAGGRAITLEHGMSGAYREQIHSVATVLGTWGEPQAQYHRAAGAPQRTIIPIGWPRLATRDLVPEGHPSLDLLYFGQPVPALSAGNWPEDGVNAARMVGSYADRHPDRRVAWKPHPASNAYGGAHDPGPGVRRVAGDSLDLIARSRIVAVTSSTTALEAMVLGRPVIQLPSLGQTGGPDFVRESGAATPVASQAEFDDAAERLLQDQAAQRRAIEAGRAYLAGFISGFSVAGHAERRLAEVVRALAAGLG